MSRLLEKFQINILLYVFFLQFRGQGPDSCWKYMTDLSRSSPSFLDFVPWIWEWPYIQMLIWYFSNNLDIYDYAGKLPEQHFSVWLFSNQGDKILLLLKFNEVRISEWNIQNIQLNVGGPVPLCSHDFTVPLMYAKRGTREGTYWPRTTDRGTQELSTI